LRLSANTEIRVLDMALGVICRWV